MDGPQVIEADAEEEDVQMVDNAAEPADEEEEEDPEEESRQDWVSQGIYSCSSQGHYQSGQF